MYAQDMTLSHLMIYTPKCMLYMQSTIVVILWCDLTKNNVLSKFSGVPTISTPSMQRPGSALDFYYKLAAISRQQVSCVQGRSHRYGRYGHGRTGFWTHVYY